MKTLRFALSGLLAIAVGLLVAVAQSNPPVPVPAKAADHNQAESEREKSERRPNQKGGEALISSLDKLALVIDKKVESEERDRRENNPPSHWWTTGPTIVVAFFAICSTVVAFWQWRTNQRQADLTEQSLRVAQQNADAATLAAKTAETALRLAESPDVQLIKVTAGMNEEKGGMVIEFRFRNFGRSIASDIRGYYIFGDVGKRLSDYREMVPDFAALSPGAECVFYGDIDSAVITPEFIKKAKRGDAICFINIAVVFKDRFDSPKGTAAGALYRKAKDEFLIIPRGSV